MKAFLFERKFNNILSTKRKVTAEIVKLQIAQDIYSN